MPSQQVKESAQTECAAPIVLALEKDDSLHFCMNYLRLNAIMKRDSHRVPRMDEYIDPLEER